MSCHPRFGFAAFLLAAAVSAPAASNPLTDLFSRNAAPEAAAEPPAPAREECLPQPGRSAAAGQRWVYRFDGHRKCWFQAEESTAPAKKAVRRHVARQRAAAPEEKESTPRGEEAVEDARAEMLNAAPAQAPEPAPPAPAIRMLRTVPVLDAPAAAQVPPPPVLARPADQPGSGQPMSDQPGSDQPTSAQPAQPAVDVDRLLADAPAASDEGAAASSTPLAVLGAITGSGEEWTPSWLGVLLMTLGLVALLASTLRRALWPARSPAHDPQERGSVLPEDHAQTAIDSRERTSRSSRTAARIAPSFDRRAPHRPALREPSFPGYEPRGR